MSSKQPTRGNLLIVAAPSGGGKTSLVKALLEADPRLALSVSHTTREPRPGEQDGVHYHFASEAEFAASVESGVFLEHAEVFGHRYGTHGDLVAQRLADGFDVILEIDWQGARQVREHAAGCHSIFILPPSLKALRQRLSGRATDSEEVIASRMRQAREEISHWDEFDFLVVNDRFEDALADIQAIIRGLRLAKPRQARSQATLLAELLENG